MDKDQFQYFSNRLIHILAMWLVETTVSTNHMVKIWFIRFENIIPHFVPYKHDAGKVTELSSSDEKGLVRSKFRWLWGIDVTKLCGKPAGWLTTEKTEWHTLIKQTSIISNLFPLANFQSKTEYEKITS